MGTKAYDAAREIYDPDDDENNVNEGTWEENFKIKVEEVT